MLIQSLPSIIIPIITTLALGLAAVVRSEVNQLLFRRFGLGFRLGSGLGAVVLILRTLRRRVVPAAPVVGILPLVGIRGRAPAIIVGIIAGQAGNMLTW